MPDAPTHFLWTITDELTKRRRQTRYRMTEGEARKRFGEDAVKVEGSGVTSRNFRGSGNLMDLLPPLKEDK